MLENRLFISSLYLVLVAGGLLLTEIQFLFIAPLLIVALASHFMSLRVSSPFDGYYRHLRKTGLVCGAIFPASSPMFFGATFIQYQLDLPYPEFEIIAKHPAEFIQASAAGIQMFGLICLGMLLLLAYRTYKGLVAILKLEEI